MTTQRATCWSVTINNPTAEDEEALAKARQAGWKVEGQLEKGEGGTLHYQLSVKTPQVRFSALKKAFPRAHIEIARNAAALDLYVVKTESRVGKLQVAQEMYPSQAKFFDLVWEIILADTTGASEYRRPLGKRFVNPKHALVRATSALIRQGYYVENIASNPMTVHAWELFHDSFLHRWTHRQTDTVQVPTTNLSLEDITHAIQEDHQEGLRSGGQSDALSPPGTTSSDSSTVPDLYGDHSPSSTDHI